MPLLNSIIKWINYKRIYQIELYRKHAEDIQTEVLFDLLSSSGKTEWGKMLDYPSIKSLRQFRERVPVQSYEQVKPFIDRMISGEKNILWPGEIIWFAKSSGTTNSKSKFIPVSKESLEECHFRGGKDVLAIYHRNYPDSKTLTGKSLTLGGSHNISSLSNRSYYGDLSAILIENLPFWTDFSRTPPTEIALIEEFEEKIEKITKASILDNVTSFSGVPSWNLVLLKYVLEYTGKDSILEVWPNLEVFIHGGIKFEPYRKQFQKIIPSPGMRYMETYNASEGFFGIQDDLSSDDLLLMLDYGIFYEFIPPEEINNEYPKAIPLWEVEKGVNYAIVISTNGGLWRYLIGDTVIFTSKNPYKIRITGRTKHFINAFGEEVIIDNAEKALSLACLSSGASIREYTAGPIFMGDNQKGTHQWLIEFETQPDSLEKFTRVLDDKLKEINSDYESKRYKNITLELPHVTSVKEGTYLEWMRRRGKIGGQNKVPRLSNDRTFLEPLIKIHNELNH